MSDKTDEVREAAEETDDVEPESDSEDEPVFTIDEADSE
jgi:hypothetical protein